MPLLIMPTAVAFETLDYAAKDVAEAFAVAVAKSGAEADLPFVAFDDEVAAAADRFEAWVVDAGLGDGRVDGRLRSRAREMRDRILLELRKLAGQIREMVDVWTLGVRGDRLREPGLIWDCMASAIVWLERVSDDIDDIMWVEWLWVRKGLME